MNALAVPIGQPAIQPRPTSARRRGKPERYIAQRQTGADACQARPFGAHRYISATVMKEINGVRPTSSSS